ncbi:hypothetical protein Q5752_003544 [Cryptotrichosporon argae]
MSSSPTRTASGAPLASSSPLTQVPDSMIAAIGVGFVGLGLALFALTIAARMRVVHRSAQQQRRQGRDVTFRQAWYEAGGWWAWFAGESAGVGGGGWGADALAAVDVGEKEMGECDNAEQGDLREWHPIAIAPPTRIQTHATITLEIVLLIAFPSETTNPAELPDVTIGTTRLVLFVAEGGLAASSINLSDKAKDTPRQAATVGPPFTDASGNVVGFVARWQEGERAVTLEALSGCCGPLP